MNNSALRISVIVPCYNAAAYLGHALNSVFAQTLVPDEVIVIDDGSTDQSAVVAASYGERLHCHRQNNEGIAAARNYGLRLARGDVIAFLDADDLWTPNSLELRAQRLTSESALDGVFGQIESFISPELPDPVKRTLACPADAQFGRLVGALLVRREIFQRVGGFNTGLHVGETLDWIARAEEQGARMDGVAAVVLRRRIHSANTISRTQRLHSDYLQVLRAALLRRRAGTGGRAGPGSGMP